MVKESSFEILTEDLFRKTYGFSSKSLYFKVNHGKRDKIREAVLALRLSYEGDFCSTPYNKKEIRDAYMISYYPYYYLPAYNVMSHIVLPALKSFRKFNALNVTYLAGGPCPELFGTALAVSESKFANKISGYIFDSEPGWKNYQNITFALCNELGVATNFQFVWDILNIADPNIYDHDCTLCARQFFCSKYASAIVHDTDVVFVQNYLSHEREVGAFLRYLHSLAECAKSGTVFAFVDLHYDSTNKIFDNICDEEFLEAAKLRMIDCHIPTEGWIIADHAHIPADGLRLDVFSDSATDRNPSVAFGIRTNVFNAKIDELDDTDEFLMRLEQSANFKEYIDGTEFLKGSNEDISLLEQLESVKQKPVTEFLKRPKRYTKFYYVVLQRI